MTDDLPARRIEAGDWVVAIGPSVSTAPGLGKLSGGDYDPATGELALARVEYPAGPRAIRPGELERVAPSDEAALVEEALGRGLVPEPRAAALHAALDQFHAGKRTFVRTPGLLDALWAALDEPLGAPGLVEWFELGAEALHRVRSAQDVPLAAWIAPPEPEGPGETTLVASPTSPQSDDDLDDDLSQELEDEGEPEWYLDRVAELEDEEDLDALPVAERENFEVARGLAAAFLASDWTAEGMRARSRESIGQGGPWVTELAERVQATYPDPPHHDWVGLALFIAADEGLRFAWRNNYLRVWRLFLPAPAMAAKRRFAVPEIATAPALADWLGLSLSDLDWLADPRQFLVRASSPRLHHYRISWLRKANGSRRLVEAPKEVLKIVQRQILDRILANVPPHDAAHGFRRGRSVLSFAGPHAKKDLVLRMDLREFFPSVRAARVAAMFRTIGYPRPVAWLLTGLTTTRTPDRVLDAAGLDSISDGKLRVRHLPQGAPTSPAIANLCAFRLDVRLNAAAARFSGTYTRYADDLAFSGGPEFRRAADRLRLLVVRIAAEEGFAIHWEKNRWMRPHAQQRLTGLVLNERPRPSRAEFDQLKATLHNCVRHGPDTQNRDGRGDYRAHLRGRVAWFEQTDPARGARLRAMFGKIRWP